MIGLGLVEGGASAMKNVKLGQRLLVGFGLLVLALIGLVSINLQGLNEITSAGKELTQHLWNVHHVAQMRATMIGSLAGLREIVQQENAAERAVLVESIRNASAAAVAERAEYQERAVSDDTDRPTSRTGRWARCSCPSSSLSAS